MRFQCTLVGHFNWVRGAVFSPDGRSALSVSDDMTARLWDVRSRQCVHSFQDFTGKVFDGEFHPDGRCIATATEDAIVQLWDARRPGLLQHYMAHSAPATSVSFHSSGSFLLSSSRDGTAKIWDLREGQLFYTLYGHSGAVECASFSPEGDFFATGGADSHALLWRTHFDQECLKKAQAPERPRDPRTHATSSADNIRKPPPSFGAHSFAWLHISLNRMTRLTPFPKPVVLKDRREARKWCGRGRKLGEPRRRGRHHHPREGSPRKQLAKGVPINRQRVRCGKKRRKGLSSLLARREARCRRCLGDLTTCKARSRTWTRA